MTALTLPDRTSARGCAVAALSWAALAAIALWAPRPASWWRELPAAAWVAACAVEVRAVVRWAGRRQTRRGGASAATSAAIACVLSDLAALGPILAGREDWQVVGASAWIFWGAMLAIGGAVLWAGR